MSDKVLDVNNLSQTNLIYALRSGMIQNDKIFVDLPPQSEPSSPYYVICNSVPKAGTYLLVEFVKALGVHVDTGYHCYTSSINKVNIDGSLDNERMIPAPLWSSALKEGYFCAAHVEYDPIYEQFLLSRKEHKMLFIIRDPRDLVISWVDFVFNSTSYVKMRKWNQFLREKGKLSYPDDVAQIAEAIRSQPKSGIMNYLSWVNSPACMTIRFEHLYQELTDVSLNERPTLDGICDYLGVERRSWKEFVGVAGTSLTESGRKQKIGIYRERMNLQHLDLMRDESFQRMVVEFGYEPTPESEEGESQLAENADTEQSIGKLAADHEKQIAIVVAERESFVASLVAQREKQIAEIVAEREFQTELVARRDQQMAVIMAAHDAFVASLVVQREKQIAEIVAEREFQARLVAERDRQMTDMVATHEAFVASLVEQRERQIAEIVAEREFQAKLVAERGELISQLVAARDSALAENIRRSVWFTDPIRSVRSKLRLLLRRSP